LLPINSQQSDFTFLTEAVRRFARSYAIASNATLGTDSTAIHPGKMDLIFVQNWVALGDHSHPPYGWLRA